MEKFTDEELNLLKELLNVASVTGMPTIKVAYESYQKINNEIDERKKENGS